jgi:hypothetical protein
MTVSYSELLEEMVYSKDKVALLAACDATLSRVSGFDIQRSLENQFPDQNVLWCTWHGNPKVAIVFVGASVGSRSFRHDIARRVRKIPNRSEEDTVGNYTT